MIRVHDDETGLELTVKDGFKPNTTLLTIFAPKREALREVIDDIKIDFPNAQFTDPALGADGGWGTIAHIEGEFVLLSSRLNK